MKSPADPILQPGDEVNRYAKDKHEIAEAILINLFHRFHFLYGCPKNYTQRSSWKRVHRGLIHHEYTTPNGRYLTNKGFIYVQSRGKEFTQNEPPS